MKQTTKQKLSAIKEMVKENAADMGITPKKLFKQIANEGQQQPVQGEGFTPGEWIVVNSGGMVTTERDNGYIIIATLETSPLKINPEIEANARLIAEAKNMYAALINLVDVWDRGDMHLYPQGKEMLKKAKAIINRIK
jgi:hypothetical protein